MGLTGRPAKAQTGRPAKARPKPGPAYPNTGLDLGRAPLLHQQAGPARPVFLTVRARPGPLQKMGLTGPGPTGRAGPYCQHYVYLAFLDIYFLGNSLFKTIIPSTLKLCKMTKLPSYIV